jgi:sirohydrochlorin ferrochelatase
MKQSKKNKSTSQALLIVDHGSTRKEANDMLKLVAARCKKLAPKVAVHYAHMELAEPTIAQGFEQCVKDGARQVTVLPYMLSPGRHAVSDIPNMVAECAQHHPGVKFKVTPPLGLSTKIAEVVMERAGL